MDSVMTVTSLFILAVSGYFAVRLHGMRAVCPLRRLRAALNPRRAGTGVSPLGGMCMALAGTLGVGNIAGVATALWLGGPGAIFWMIFSGLAVTVLKYAEIVLAIRHRRRTANGTVGGAPYYISDLLFARGHAGAGRLLACLFAWLCLLNALTMGSVLQINAAASALHGAFGLPPLVTGLTAAGLCAVVMSGGASRIAALTERLVPFMTVGFLLLCGAVLILRRERLPGAVAAILREAFSPANAGAAAGGGVGGFLLTRAVRVGVMRGLVSNEAGCGTAPMAHAAADTDSPATQGVLGMLEVFVDTVLLCSITALTVLVGDTGYTAFGADGAACARAAFTSVLGNWAGGVFGISVFLFALASAFCWAHYGMTCVGYLRARRPGTGLCWRMLFTLAFCSALILGALMAPSLAWTLADAAIAAMTILNLSCLLLGAREIAAAR